MFALQNPRRKKGAEDTFESIRAENFPNLGKEIDIQIQEAQSTQERINPKRPTPRYIVINMSKKGQILKAAKEIYKFHIRQLPWYCPLTFQQKICRPERIGMIILKWWKGKTNNLEYSSWQGPHSDYKERSNVLQTRWKLKEFGTTKPALQEMFKRIL